MTVSNNQDVSKAVVMILAHVDEGQTEQNQEQSRQPRNEPDIHTTLELDDDYKDDDFHSAVDEKSQQ